jgi:hypothetical protein
LYVVQGHDISPILYDLSKNHTRQLIADPTLKAYTQAQEFVGMRINSYKTAQKYDWHVDMGDVPPDLSSA